MTWNKIFQVKCQFRRIRLDKRWGTIPFYLNKYNQNNLCTYTNDIKALLLTLQNKSNLAKHESEVFRDQVSWMHLHRSVLSIIYIYYMSMYIQCLHGYIFVFIMYGA